MIATAAESNPSCFSPTPLVDLEETMIPAYIRLCAYFGNHLALTKFCVAQFKATHVNLKKADAKKFREVLSKAKSYDDLTTLVGSGAGEDEFREILKAIESRSAKPLRRLLQESCEESPSSTPPRRDNPEPPGLGAPLIAANGHIMIPAVISGHDALTPTPMPVM